jgi:hypothetical protein
MGLTARISTVQLWKRWLSGKTLRGIGVEFKELPGGMSGADQLTRKTLMETKPSSQCHKRVSSIHYVL